MKKIILFTSSLSYGGAEHQMYNIFKILREEYDSKIVVARNSIFKENGILVLNKKKTLGASFTFFKILINEKPDIIMSTLPIPNLISSIAKIFLKKKPIVINREANYNLDSKLNKFLFLTSSRFSDLHFFNSKKVLENYSYKYKKISRKFVKINNILDDKTLEYLKKIQNKKTSRGDYLNGVVVARLEKNKGIDLVINAMNKLENEKIKISIIGLGTEEKKLKNLSNNQNLKFLGYVDNPIKLLANYDFFILPSRKEGMSNSLIHALALNKLCIVSDCIGGNAELINNYSQKSLIFRDGDVSDLIEKINKISMEKDFNTTTSKKFYKDFSEVEYLKNFNQIIDGIENNKYK